MKKYILLFGFLINISCSALTLDEMREPGQFLGRVSNSDKPEKFSTIQHPKASTSQAKKEDITPTVQSKTVQKEENFELPQIAKQDKEPESYADLSLKRLSEDVSIELEQDETKTNSDLAILWQAVTERSETIKYTIYKLSNPDEDKPDESTIKKILKPIANFGTLAGVSAAGDPYMAAGALVGGGLINAFMKDDKEVNYTFSKVSDADMVLLIRKIDELQKKLLDLYIDYKTKQKLAYLTQENYEKRELIYRNAQNKSREELIIADVYYRNAKTNAQRAMDEYMTSRAILENLAGKDALEKIENE